MLNFEFNSDLYIKISHVCTYRTLFELITGAAFVVNFLPAFSGTIGFYVVRC